MLLVPTQAAFAGPCEDAERYRQLFHQTEAAATAEAATGPAGCFSSLRFVPLLTKYKALYEAADAECAKLRAGLSTAPHTESSSTGYGPPRTGLDWKPFLADLRPRAVASQLRQGDNYAGRGDMQAAARYYDLASRIDPSNQLARQKADEAHKSLNQTQPIAPPAPPEQTTPLPQSSPVDRASPKTPSAASQPVTAELEALPSNVVNNYLQNPSPAAAEGVKSAIRAQAPHHRIQPMDDTPDLGK